MKRQAIDQATRWHQIAATLILTPATLTRISSQRGPVFPCRMSNAPVKAKIGTLGSPFRKTASLAHVKLL
jgi:hypothetical protein